MCCAEKAFFFGEKDQLVSFTIPVSLAISHCLKARDPNTQFPDDFKAREVMALADIFNEASGKGFDFLI